jgi:homoprotocatechuate degradation regulator HpaR
MPAVKSASTPASAAVPPLPHRNLPLLLLLAREGVIALFRPILHAHGLTEQQWRVLRVLVEFGPLEPREIGRLCGLSSPSLAGILARMDEQALITRQTLAHDRRRQAVSATAKSRRLAARMAPEIEAAYQALEDRLGPVFVGRLYATLDELNAALADQPAG